MYKWKIPLQIMVLSMTMVCAVPAQNVPQPIRPANFFDRLAWSLIKFVEPRSAPTFLYGYSISALENSTIKMVINEYMAGNVLIALVRQSPSGYEAWVASDEELQALQREEKLQHDNALIALSRPLRDKHIGDAEEQAFVAKPRFWKEHLSSR